MRLHEILDKPVKLNVVKHDPGKSYKARGTFGDREIEFKLNSWATDREHWNFTFVELGDDYTDGETFDATGKGSELAIFASAKAFLEDAIKVNNPGIIHFESEKATGSRDKLYKRFVARWKPAGYTYREFADHSDVRYHGFVRDDIYARAYSK